MADFSLTTLFVVPSTQTTLPATGSTQALTAGQFGVFKNDYVAATSANIAAAPYFYLAQGRTNTYLQATKRSDKISGKLNAGSPNILEFYKVAGCPTPVTQVTDIQSWNVKCGEIVSLTLRAHSSYLDTLYFNGYTKSVTVQAPCCDCGGDPCTTVDVPALIDAFILKLQAQAPGANSDNIGFNNFYTFQRIGNDANAKLRISEKPLTKYGQPCDVAAFPFEYDRMWFRSFVYAGPATTADFIVDDSCATVADEVITQRSSYARGTADEIAQMEKNFYSYQAGYLKHLYRMSGYNPNFESWVNSGATYDTYYIKFGDYDRSTTNWGDFVHMDSQVIVASSVANAGTFGTAFEAILVAAMGAVPSLGAACLTTTSTTTTVWPTTSTTSTLIP